MSTPEQPPLIRKLLARREHHVKRSLVYRILFGVTGAVVLAAGVVMLVTPGPAFVLIPVGLAMLALEFEWAEKLLVKALQQAEKARETARNTTRRQRVLGVLGTTIAVAVVAYLAFKYVI
jgi:uncharacterized protein (TIGR02611 family)